MLFEKSLSGLLNGRRLVVEFECQVEFCEAFCEVNVGELCQSIADKCVG